MNFEIDISKRIDLISPSQAKILMTCPLKLVFSKIVSNYYPFLEHPAYILGSIIHEIIDRVYKGTINSDDFEVEWKKLLEIRQIKYFKNPLNRVNYPLEYWIPFYTVKKKMVEELIRNRLSLQKNDRRQTNNILTEIDMQFEFLFGRIDYFYQDEEKVFIKDFKTGSINNFHKGRKTGLKDEYLEQLKTYGLIVKKKMKLSPSSIYLSLVCIDGSESEPMNFSEDIYDQHYLILKSKFEAVQNCRSLEDYQRLGVPGNDVCNFCKFRPICVNYKREIKEKEIQNHSDLHVDKFDLRIGRNNIELLTNGRTIGGIPIENMIPLKKYKSEEKPINIFNLIRGREDNIYYWSKYSNYFEG